MKVLDVGGPDLPTPGTPHNPCTCNTKPATTPSQPGIKDWPGTEHPFWELDELIETAQCMLEQRRRQNTVAKYLLRVIKCCPGLGVRWEVTRGCYHLPPVLKITISAPKTKDVELLLGEARQILRGLIVADEDAKFPGSRNVLGVGGELGRLINTQTKAYDHLTTNTGYGGARSGTVSRQTDHP
jgi:hypothetical protein